MSDVKKKPGKPDLFPSSWIVGPNAAAKLARGDDGVMVAPELSGEDLRPRSGGRSKRAKAGQVSVDDIWKREPSGTAPGDDATMVRGSAVGGAEVPAGLSATRNDHQAHVPGSKAEETLTLHAKEPDPAEIDTLWHDMDDLNARFGERERTASRLRMEPTLSSASLAATDTGPVSRGASEPEVASLGIRLAAAAAVILAVMAVGHRFDIPSAEFWEKTDSWVVDQASSVLGLIGSGAAED